MVWAKLQSLRVSKFPLKVKEIVLLYCGIHGIFTSWTAPVLGALLCSRWAMGRMFGSVSARPAQPSSGIWSSSCPVKKSVKAVKLLQWWRLAQQQRTCPSSSRIPPLQQWAPAQGLALKQQLLMFLPGVMSDKAERYRCKMFVCTTQGNFACAVVLFWLP